MMIQIDLHQTQPGHGAEEGPRKGSQEMQGMEWHIFLAPGTDSLEGGREQSLQEAGEGDWGREKASYFLPNLTAGGGTDLPV